MKMISYKTLFSTLLEFLDNNRKKFLIWNIPIILSNVFGLVQPLLIGLIIDFFTSYSSGQSLLPFYRLLGILFAGSIVSEILRTGARNAVFEISADLEYNIKTKGFDNIQNNPLSWQQSENSGNKIQRLETGKNALLDLIYLIKDKFYYIIINLIGILSIFAGINPVFLLFFAIYVFSQALLIRYWNKKNPVALNRLNIARELSVGKVFEGLSNVQTIKSLGAGESFQSTINNVQDELREATKAWEKIGVDKWRSISILDLAYMLVFFLLIGYSVSNNTISVGFIFVLYSYFEKLQGITVDTTNDLNRLVEIKSNVERMLPLFESIRHSTGKKVFPRNWEEITLKDINFEYSLEEGKAVFSGIDLEIKKGNFIGITGESGSGKSSLLKVLLGLYPLTSGSYKIGQRDFSEISNEQLLKNMTVVLQDTELFNVSLLENITMFKKVNTKLLERAISISMLSDVIDSLPDGLDTVVGEKGVKFSGGQKQRIGIARAIYKDSQIILMDEATSNLDTQTENHVMNGILDLKSDKTIIAVAHRLSTLEKADVIYKFEAGKLIIQ